MKNIRFFFLCENFQFLEVKFSIYMNRRVFVMDELIFEAQNISGVSVYGVRPV